MKNLQLNALILLTLIMSSGCNDIGTAEFDEAGNRDHFSLTFSGLNSISNRTDSTVTLHWTPHSKAVAYEVLNGGHVVQIVLEKTENRITLTKLTPSHTYNFRVRMKTLAGEYDNNQNDLIVIMGTLHMHRTVSVYFLLLII